MAWKTDRKNWSLQFKGYSSYSSEHNCVLILPCSRFSRKCDQGDSTFFTLIIVMFKYKSDTNCFALEWKENHGLFFLAWISQKYRSCLSQILLHFKLLCSLQNINKCSHFVLSKFQNALLETTAQHELSRSPVKDSCTTRSNYEMGIKSKDWSITL